MRALVLALLVCAAPALAAPVSYVAPRESAHLAAGQGSDLAEGQCGACHSLDYITTQPRPLPQPSAFWTAEVAKMKKAYGARISDQDSAAIIAYLAANYGGR
jgi:mono/diheme cytochrome c family protein